MVAWNQAERTWDCPCHGSRFDCVGKVINGPANRDLARVHELESPEALVLNEESPGQEVSSGPGDLAPALG